MTPLNPTLSFYIIKMEDEIIMIAGTVFFGMVALIMERIREAKKE